MPSLGCRSFRFGQFRLQVEPPALYQHGQLVPLPPKLVRTLLVLVEARGDVVSKASLMQSIWPDTFVEEGGLTRNVYLLRRALDDPGGSSHIETVHRRGYRFRRPVIVEDGPGSAAASAAVAPRLQPSVEGQVPPDGLDDAVPGTPESAGVWPRAERLRLRASRAIGLAACAAAILLGFLVVVGGDMGAVDIWSAVVRRSDGPAPPTLGAEPSAVAVLPFRSVGDHGAAAYLAYAITDDLTDRLGAVSALRVRPAAAVLRHPWRDYDPQVAGRALKVDYILDGTVLTTGDAIDLTVRLLAVDDEGEVWEATYRVPAADLPAQQGHIARAVLRALEVPFSDAEGRQLMGGAASNRQAYEAYGLARFLWHHDTAASVAHAATHFEEASRLDPGWARPVADLAAARAYLPLGLSDGPSLDMGGARELAQRALALDTAIASAHRTLGIAALVLDHDQRTAELELTRALDLRAGDVSARGWLALSLMTRGQNAEAIWQLETAAGYDPASPGLATLLAAANYEDHRYDAAIAHAEGVIGQHPDLAQPRVWRGLAFAALGDLGAAVEDLTVAVEHDPRSPGPLAALGYAYGLQGNRKAVEQTLERLRSGAFARPPEPHELAAVDVSLGDTNQAFEALKGCLTAVCHPSTHLARVDPRLEALRRDDRFRSIAGAMKRRGLRTVATAGTSR